MTATLRSPFNLSAHLRPTVGDQKISYVGVDHMGWMVCDGRIVSRTTYALLFNVIGETFGVGDGSTTFKLPDMRGCVPGMAGQPNFNSNSGDVNDTPYTLGTYAGEQRHKLNIDEMPTHTHGSSNASGDSNGDGYTTLNGEHFHTGTTSNAGTHNHGGVTGSGGYAASNHEVAVSLTTTFTADDTGSHTHSISEDGNHNHQFTTSTESNHQHQIFNTGGSNYHNNMQPTLFAGNMFIYSGRNMDAYFPYTWVNAGTPTPSGYDSNVAVVPGRVLIF